MMLTDEELEDLRRFYGDSIDGNGAIGDAPIPSDAALRAIRKTRDAAEQRKRVDRRLAEIAGKP